MRVHQRVRNADGWSSTDVDSGPAAQLVLIFSTTAILADRGVWSDLRRFYPGARLVACSTAGEIHGINVQEDTVVCTSLAFEHSKIAVSSTALSETADDSERGALLLSRLPQADLSHVFVLSDGLKVNGSALVKGITSKLPAHIGVTGGLAADGDRFQQTAVCLDGPTPTEQVVAVGFYGPRLRFGYGSLGGWDPFGPERCITKSRGNVLHELDGEPALDLYKRYLGAHAATLPASGLLFPLTIRSDSDSEPPVVRTILAVDEQANTLTFAGDVPVGYRARLMRANFERLVDGAGGAAKAAQRLDVESADLAILISCVGRKLVLKQRVEEEVEAVREVLGPACALTGFYSYGEISPFTASARCELHNQTMTITTLTER